MEPLQWTAVGGIVVACAIIGFVWWRGRITPEERERRRRASLERHGRIAEATITDVDGHTIFYLYSIEGVQYEASQDVAGLLPAGSEPWVGPAACKYQRNLPGNSIVISEGWSGIRQFRKEP